MTYRLEKTAAAMLFCLAFSYSAAAEVPTFEQAYKREASELSALKAALEKTRASLEEKAAAQKKALEAEIHAARASADALKKRERALQREVDILSEKEALSSDRSSVLDAVLKVAEQRAAGQGKDAAESGDNIEAFSRAVEAAAKDIESGGTTFVKDEAFFDTNGKQTKGKIIHIGDIAALGVSENTGGVLGKLSSGGYRLIDESERETAKKLLTGEHQGPVPVFLFSKDAKGQGVKKKKGLFETADAGGPVAWAILGLAALGLLLIVERVFTLARCTNWWAGRFDKLSAELLKNDFDAASKIAAKMGSVGLAVRSVIENRLLTREEIEKRAGEQVLKIMPKIERSLTVLSVITAIAPLLGLLGTVTGMIETFDVITEHGTGDPKLLSGGISEALITTELGLAVAVPFLLLRSLLARWADRIVENMQTHALAAVNLLVREKSDAEH